MGASRATSLAKHWRDEGEYLEGYSLLQPVYGWFVEGFDTASSLHIARPEHAQAPPLS